MPEDKEVLDKEVIKQAQKEAMKEWMDEKYAQIGRWSVNAFLVALVGAMAYFILLSKGWHHK